MIVAGIVCFCLPVDTTMSVFAYIVGAIVLVIGIVEIIGFFTTAGFVGGGAFLADGIITTILGVVLLANEGVVAGFIPFIFAMWFIIEGISELSLAISASKYHVPYWWTLLILSILEIVFGFLTFFDPIGGAISMAVMVGTFLMYTVSRCLVIGLSRFVSKSSSKASSKDLPYSTKAKLTTAVATTKDKLKRQA